MVEKNLNKYQVNNFKIVFMIINRYILYQQIKLMFLNAMKLLKMFILIKIKFILLFLLKKIKIKIKIIS